MGKNERLYNLDLIRIIAMLMIVILHFVGKSGLWDYFPANSTGYNIVWACITLCNVGVNAFILISGYFLIKSSFKLKNLLALSSEVLFYSFFIYMGLVLFGQAEFALPDFVSALFPILTGKYWFITMYVGMYLLAPFLNKLIGCLTRREHAGLATILVTLFSIWPVVVFFGAREVQSYALNYGFSALWFMVLYIIAAYVRLYYAPDYRTLQHFVRYLFAAALSISVMLGTTYLGEHGIKLFEQLRGILNGYNSINILIPSLFFFVFMLNLKIRARIPVKLIGFFAPLTFGVYLIHEESHLAVLLWRTVNPLAHLGSWSFLPYAVGSVLAIYLGSSLIDWLRLKLFSTLGPILFGDMARFLRQYDIRIVKKHPHSTRP